MKIGIVGVGSLGSVLGCLMLEADLDCVMIERDPEEVRIVREQGMWVEGVSGDRLVRPRIFADTSEAGKVDLAIVLVKSYDTRCAIRTVEEILSQDGLVLTLQNGVGNFEILNEAFPGRVLLGTTTMGAMTLGPGRFRHTGFGDTHLGEADGSIQDRTRAVGFQLARINSGPVHIVDNAVGCVWSKLIINAGINAAATLLRVRNGDLPGTEAGRELIHWIVKECLAVVEAKGIGLVFESPEERVLAVCQGTAANINSMLQDIRAGRKTEIDFINGAVAREGDNLGVPVPVNRTLALLIKALEASADKRVHD
ncbi:MAG: 2-dehydropantoate 2-reductase [Deltaproteobacteria bacterium]|nr:2-dehydropantoate 2-reductase [Deltaproteobacteria bacterium]